MESLKYNQLTSLISSAPQPPILQPTSASIGPYECPICLTYKPNIMLNHLSCMRTFCAECLVSLLDNSSNCPICRKLLIEYDWNGTSRSFITRPTPNDNFWLDKVMYSCQFCEQEFPFQQAISHPSVCQSRNSLRHQPPSHIGPRSSSNTRLIETISNPSSRILSQDADRLLIVHVNGRQLFSKFFSRHKSVFDVKSKIQSLSGKPIRDLKIFKFFHLEAPNHLKIGDVAKSQGATYLSCFTENHNLSTHCANMILEEIGPCPIVQSYSRNVRDPANGQPG